MHKISDKDEEVLALSGSVPHACHAQPHRALRVCALLQHTEKVTEKVLNTIPGTQHYVSLRAEKQGSFRDLRGPSLMLQLPCAFSLSF